MPCSPFSCLMPYELGHFQLLAVGLMAPIPLPLSYDSTCCQLYVLPGSSSVYVLPAPSAPFVPRILPSPFCIMLQLSYDFTCCSAHMTLALILQLSYEFACCLHTCPLIPLTWFLSPHEQATSTPAARPYMTPFFALPRYHVICHLLLVLTSLCLSYPSSSP